MIGKYESGQTEPTASNLRVICDLLDVSVDYLLGASDHPNRCLEHSDLDFEETHIIQIYRRDGWTGVIRLGAEKLSH